MSPRAAPDRSPATEQPVARVAVDIPLAHLDRPFDYQVSAAQSDAAQPGVRVRVRFAGQLVDGFVLDRLDASEHGGRLTPLARVLGAEPVLRPEIAGLVRAVADRWAGTFADVVRLSVPPRHAAAEKLARPRPAEQPVPAPTQLDRYDAGTELLVALAGGGSPRRVWGVLPRDWPTELAAPVAATVASGRGAVVVVPDARDVVRMDRALADALGPGRHVALTADLGPAERYRRFLAASRGDVPVVVGTRAAVWAPVRDLGLIVIWDDGDDLYAEPRAPYPHARDVAVLRAHRAGAGLLLAGHARTAEGALLVGSRWADAMGPTQAARDTAVPAVAASGGDEELGRDPAAREARLPSLAWRTAREALVDGPVLIQVPRRGYQPSLSCASCRTPARCAVCAGPLGRAADRSVPACRWCGAAATSWTCPVCGVTELRAVVVGARRTAEELGRAFPGVPVRTSGGGAVLDTVDDRPALVVATPGAEPVATAGYAAALLLDGWALLSRLDLRATEEALRRWLNAAALVRGRGEGGRVVVVAPGELRGVQALVRWAPDWHADRELEDRQALHLPPFARVATVTGTAVAVADVMRSLELPPAADVLGPVPAGDAETTVERMIIRVPRTQAAALAASLKAAAAGRSARKATDSVRIELDPQQLG
jgi:primosomal protein N' (replication factor Y) (superfamily II helicase)